MRIVKILLILNILFLASCSYEKSREKLMLAREYADRATKDLMQGNYEQARAGFNLSLEVATIPEGYDGLGCVAFYQKDYKLAEEYFIKSYEEDKNYLRALSNLALLYDVLGLKEESKNIYKFVIERKPENYRDRNNFAGLLFDNTKEGQSQALDELQKASTLKKDDIIIDNIKKVKAFNKGGVNKEGVNKSGVSDVNKDKDIKSKKILKNDAKKLKLTTSNVSSKVHNKSALETKEDRGNVDASLLKGKDVNKQKRKESKKNKIKNAKENIKENIKEKKKENDRESDKENDKENEKEIKNDKEDKAKNKKEFSSDKVINIKNEANNEAKEFDIDDFKF
ncbi:MAG: tetratricopeptide repeat protein [Bdellovibrionota bacterium]